MENEKFGAVVVDWKLPDGSGADLFPIIFEHQPDTPVIIITGMRDFDVAVTALREGAYDFLLSLLASTELSSWLKRLSVILYRTASSKLKSSLKFDS